MTTLTIDQIWQALEDVKDPEIPVVSLVDMGIARDVAIDGERVIVTITPTFAGCPALNVMREDIVERLTRLGAGAVEVRTQLSPPWTTEWIRPEARERMKTIGLAPPPRHQGDVELVFMAVAECPHCGSTTTVRENPFGPTLCRSIHYCHSCHQPFEQFKPL
jgi:ring-1,2-phenylacetyl-CoA epoxidase subunit PaaD